MENMKTLTIDVPDRIARRVNEAAERLGLSPEELVRASVEEKLKQLDTSFGEAAQRVLQKNAELYRRLA